ncbi:MAG: transposase [Lactobacillus paracasei subsp. paracasei]|nr:transposase [Lacticaseibacillus paracasei]NLT80759.1 transposase [Lacticaseibacillus paracasei subsp. paracasei]RND47502.1 Transposase DDE domain protein [Lacticaseibacillus paracasei]RNE05738.1 Transposase DDE domain protein [Lacticaseibacillus paracasei]
MIVDAQSVKTTDLTKNSGYDGGKKISGIKRHLAVDINGFPQAIHITRANITDRDGAIALVTLNLEQFKLVRTMMVDSGYTGQNFANEISSLTSAKVIVVKEMSYTNFRLSPNGGSLNVHLVGWEIIIVYGVTVSVSSTLVS